MFDISA
jgi:hypothetical protein